MRFKKLYDNLSTIPGFSDLSKEQMFYSGAMAAIDVITKVRPKDERDLLAVLWLLVDDLESSSGIKKEVMLKD